MNRCHGLVLRHCTMFPSIEALCHNTSTNDIIMSQHPSSVSDSHYGIHYTQTVASHNNYHVSSYSKYFLQTLLNMSHCLNPLHNPVRKYLIPSSYIFQQCIRDSHKKNGTSISQHFIYIIVV